MTLLEIGTKHGTDKATTHFYMDNYEKHLSEWRDKEFILLEIGVGNGSSIKMWREAFPKASVYGIDINPDCAGDGIFIADATQYDYMINLIHNVIGRPDVVIDDGSHVGGDMIKTFQMLFPLLNSGGLYCLEDTHTLYSTHYSGEFESNGRTRGYNFFTDLSYHVDVAGRAMCGNPEVAINWGNPDPPVPRYSRELKAIHTYPSLWIYEKR